ncbi:hypothetical protein [Mycobacterium montefiorense]|uniref:hypothetical protein n=1 Tax=Mycobacterium montefiorense TaxID=154654 RepID=UPI0021F3950F|nr:hypothetical protein [Mycobacterium montefiorense]MCV7428062.1 hypothetical protein [Mycobacterium montefiorense]
MSGVVKADDSYPEEWGYQRDDEPAADRPISSLKSGLADYGTPQADPNAYPESWGYKR